MWKISLRTSLLGFLLLALMACSSGNPILPQSTRPASTSSPRTPTVESTSIALSPTGQVLLLKPAVPIPASCPVNPVYVGPLGKQGLTDVPWVKAEPLSSQVTAFLFFVEPTYQQTHTYQPLHIGGSYPHGRSTKILWVLTGSSPPGAVVITGVKVSSPHETIQQAFPMAGAPGPGWDYPSIVNIPTP